MPVTAILAALAGALVGPKVMRGRRPAGAEARGIPEQPAVLAAAVALSVLLAAELFAHYPLPGACAAAALAGVLAPASAAQDGLQWWGKLLVAAGVVATAAVPLAALAGFVAAAQWFGVRPPLVWVAAGAANTLVVSAGLWISRGGARGAYWPQLAGALALSTLMLAALVGPR